MEQDKPPLGIMPFYVWKSVCNKQRIIDLTDAMFRYADKKREIPLDWVLEHNKLIHEEFDAKT